MAGPHYRVEYSFSSALVEVDKETGAFDEDAFREAIVPIRGRIMRLDGLMGCYIERYSVSVNYLPNIVDEEVVQAHIKEIFQWVESEEKFFPFLKGSGTPLVIEKV